MGVLCGADALVSSIAAVFAGQGAQYVKMGVDFIESDPDWFDDVRKQCPFPLEKYLREGPAETLARTDITQPAVFVVNHLIYRYLLDHGFEASAFSGHSLGEYNAVLASGRVAFEQLFPVVLERGEAMHEAAQQVEGGMAAIVKLEPEPLENICEEISKSADVEGTVEIALFNAPAQTVVSGSIPAIEQTVEQAEEAGALKAIPLDVSGPWHSQYMAPATARLRKALSGVSWSGGADFVSNVEADYLGDDSPEQTLIAQLEQPVRWQESIEALLENGYDTFVEVGPGKALSGMIKRIARSSDFDVDIYSTDTKEQTDQLLEEIQ